MGTPPGAVVRLVGRFDRDRKVFLSPDYKEDQLRAEFLNPFFESLGRDMNRALTWFIVEIGEVSLFSPNLPEMVAGLRKGLRAAGQTQPSAGPVYSGDTVSFQTAEPAPPNFDRFTVFWTAPNVSEGAEFSYDIRSGQGDSCFTSDTESAYPGSHRRSDMWLGEVDPAKLQGRDVVVRFWATKGKVEFPADPVPTFQFYKNWHVIKRVPGNRKER